VVTRDGDMITAPLGDDLMMLNIEQGAYFGINDIGAAIWRGIAEPIAVGELCAGLLAEFDVAPEQCEAEVITFLTQLRDVGLARVVS
jgi:hypothetical protein